MRDPKRIRPFLEKLAKKWEEYPDLRFGQLVVNIADLVRVGDIWFPEEKEWEVGIEAFAVVPGKYRGEV